MAEALAVIGLVAAITQFVDYGYKVVKRLDEFTSATSEVPESFRSIQTRLQLVIETLKRVQVRAGAGRFSEADAQALKPVVQSSLAHAQELTSIIDKAVPDGKFSTFERRLHALKSLAYDRKVQKIVEQLQSDIQILIFFQTTSHSDTSDEIREELSRLSLTPTSPPPNYAFGLDLGAAPQIEEGAFMGREAELRQLCDWLTPPGQTVVAVSALGGMGKTQLSIAFAKQSRAVFSSVFWMNAKDELGLKQDLVALSQRIFEQSQPSSVGGQVDEDQIIEQLRRWFSRAGNDRWLILFDNYDDPKIPGVKSDTGYDIRRYFPHRSQGSILITTRSRRLKFAKQLRLQKIEDVEQSVAILSQRSDRDLKNDPNAVKLAKRLDGLPLALATAGMYLGQCTSSVDEYLDTYEQHWQDLSHNADELLEYEDRTLFSTWSLSLTQVRDQDPEAAEFLGLLAYFGNQDFWYELIRAGEFRSLAWLTALTETKQRFERAMARLHDYSLIEITGEGYSLHTCVHDWTLQALNHEISSQYYWLAVECVASLVKRDSERDWWETNRRLGRHAIRLGHPRLANVFDEGKLDEDDCVGLHYLGILLNSQGKIAEAEQMYQRALAGYEKALGPDHPSTLRTVNNLGNLYCAQGEIVEAEQMYQRALVGKEKALGSYHTSTLQTVHNLGKLYYEQGKMVEAEQLHQRALAGFEKTLGPDHAFTLDTVNSLGNLYIDQCNLVEAEQKFQRALAGYEKALGPDHTSTLRTVNNLGNLYCAQGKIVEAEQMYQRALVGKEKALGSDHTLTLQTVHNLGTLYHDQGKMMEAEQLYQRALAGFEKTSGPDHKFTLATAKNLRDLYRDQDNIAEGADKPPGTGGPREVDHGP